MDEPLREYRAKRDFQATSEPAPAGAPAETGGAPRRFSIQEHHARRLHWDLRLEHEGVLLSWALPRGVPDTPGENRLAVRTEDHPLDYLEFEGQIPAGQYGAGKVTVWDRGTYVAEKLEPEKLVVVLEGKRVQGRYALFHTRERNWMIHRMDPPANPAEPMPAAVAPMLARLGPLPAQDSGWAYEVKWDGVRAIAYARPGELRIESRNLNDLSPQYPELRALGRALGARTAVLDGEIVAFDADGRPSFARLQQRMHLTGESTIRRRAREVPVVYVIFDLLYLEGRSLMHLGYEQRRARLEELDLQGSAWQTPAAHRSDGARLLRASAEHGLEGVVAKRLDSRYEPGRRGGDWIKVKNTRRQELVIGGWLPGKGRRRERIGALLVGHFDGERKLRYAGRVGTGFGERELARLAELLGPLERPDSPFEAGRPPRGAIFVEPELVAEVHFTEWTADGLLRHPAYKGLRADRAAADVHVDGGGPATA